MNLIEVWLRRRSDLKKEHRKFLANLAKSRDKSWNRLADQTHEEVFREIDCLDCANCCKSIPPIVNETDVNRASRFLRIKAVDFKEKYLRIDEDGDMVMCTSPCPFLDDDHLCRIYEARPKACREYPHTDNQEFLKNIKLHAENSYYCPAVFHILERMR